MLSFLSLININVLGIRAVQWMHMHGLILTGCQAAVTRFSSQCLNKKGKKNHLNGLTDNIVWRELNCKFFNTPPFILKQVLLLVISAEIYWNKWLWYRCTRVQLRAGPSSTAIIVWDMSSQILGRAPFTGQKSKCLTVRSVLEQLQNVSSILLISELFPSWNWRLYLI